MSASSELTDDVTQRGEGVAQAEIGAQPGDAVAQPGEVMRIGEVAELTGTTPRTIRYYEEIGLLGCGGDREQGKHRAYSEHDVNEIKRIVRLRDLLGLPLDQLVPIVKSDRERERLQREFRATKDPARRQELLESAREHVLIQLEVVRNRLDQLRDLESELADRETRIKAALDTPEPV